MYCTDVSALYIPLGKKREWTGFHHNWVHDINGIGIRCDQDGEKVLFHHNVVWNCKAGGKANGYEMKMVFECPGEGWFPGRIITNNMKEWNKEKNKGNLFRKIQFGILYNFREC